MRMIARVHRARLFVEDVLCCGAVLGAQQVVCCADVRKYYGVIRTDLKKGDRLQFSVTHQYNTYDFNGEKELLFTTSGPFGNRNLTFGIVWLAMGGLTGCITLAYVVLGWHQIWSIERRVADLQRRWLRGSAQYHLGDTYPYPDGLPPGKQY